MKTKAKCGRQTGIYSRKLTIAGAMVPLFLLPLTTPGDVITNFAESVSLPAADVGSGFANQTVFTFTPGLTLANPFDLMLATNGNRIAISNLSPDGKTNSPLLPPGKFMLNDEGVAHALPNPPSSPKREDPVLNFGASVLVLQEPGRAIHRQGPDMSLGQGQPVVQFFVPYSHPLPPGGGSDLVRGESDRPWPVISAGVATGKRWNDPDTYRAQSLLSIHW